MNVVLHVPRRPVLLLLGLLGLAGALQLVGQLALPDLVPRTWLGLLPLPLALAGAFVHVQRREYAKPFAAALEVTPSELLAVDFDGHVVQRLARDRLRHGHLVPGVTRWSRVQLFDRLGVLRFEAELPEPEGNTLLDQLGFGARQRRRRFRISPPLLATRLRQLALGLAFVFWFAVLGPLHTVFVPLGVPLFLLAAFWPAYVWIGSDGFVWRWLWMRTFVRRHDILDVSRYDTRAVHITLGSGKALRWYTSPLVEYDRERQEVEWRAVVFEAMQRALAPHAMGAQQPTELLARGERPVAQWLAAVRALRDDRADYRQRTLTSDELREVLADPSAPEDARAAAAFALRADVEGRRSVRLATEAIVSPTLRLALEASASDVEDAEVERALDALTRDPSR